MGACTCQTSWGKAHHLRLRALGAVYGYAQGARPPLKFWQRDGASGALQLLSYWPDGWVLREVRAREDFGVFTPETQYVQRFELPACALTAAQAEVVAALDDGTWRYVVDMAREPWNADQYWAFTVLKREPLTG